MLPSRSQVIPSAGTTIQGGIDCPTDLTFLCRHQRFVVEVLRTVFPLDSPILKTSKEADADQLYDEAIGHLADAMAMLLQAFYRKLAPVCDQIALDQHLQRFYFTLSANGRALISDAQTVPRIRPEDVMVLKELWADNVCKVSVRGEIMCLKKGGWLHASLASEYKALKELLDHGLPDRVRVPRLKGIVVVSGDDEEPVMALGVLMTYIDADPWEGPMGRVKLDSVAREQRERWWTQIRNTLTELHEDGVVWGDAKPDNVLLDRDQNAWIVDFGGSWTEGWVDEDLAGTIAGDEQGLHRILERLQLTITS
ncbi:MAG: hypothetical protein M1826_002838 [Phylliscum demangeonii]|nr:MAG: hypothetical protein M1826_002838 [Phylliscum demangeonii]